MQLKIAVEEFATFKQEVINIRQSHIKWMNDVEQRNAHYKDLFYSEDYGFVEIGANEEINLSLVH